MSHLLQMRGLKHTKDADNQIRYVASFTDAWIETILNKKMGRVLTSHLLQLRGLKQKPSCRRYMRFRSHLLQMRGLKLTVKCTSFNMHSGRIFYRCVD